MSKRTLEEREPISSEEEEESIHDFSDDNDQQSSEEVEQKMIDKSKLQELKEKDPDFYEFMLKNDPSLFADEEEEIDDEEMGWTLPETFEEQKELKQIHEILVRAKKGDENALLQSVRLFIDCVKEKQVETAQDYEMIMSFAVDELPDLIEKKKGMFKIYMRGIIFALKTIDEKEIIRVFIDLINKNASKYAISDVFSKCISALSVYAFSYRDELNRAAAIETIINIMKFVKKDDARVEKAMRLIFANYMKTAKQYSRQTYEEFGESQTMIKKISLLNSKATYNILFEFIKTISLSIKNYNNDQNAFKNLCSFGCIKTFEMIALCLKATSEDKIHQLYHPFCQLLCGILSFVEGNVHVPVVLHYVQIVNMIASPKLFVSPVPAILLAIEQLTGLSPKPVGEDDHSKGKKGSKKQPSKKQKKGKHDIEMMDFTYMLTIQTQQLREIDFIVSAVDALLKELQNYFNLYKQSIAFPELTCQAVITLRKIIKNSKIVVLNNKVNNFLQKLNKDIEHVKQKRNAIDFGPFDIQKVAEFEQK